MGLEHKTWRLWLSGLVCGALASCNEETDTVYELSDFNNAVVTSFSLSDNTAVCASLSSYSFTIDQYGTSDPELAATWPGAGIIFNSDSLPYGSEPDSVTVSLSYTYPTAVMFYHYDTTDAIVDSVNFATSTLVDFSPYAKTRLQVTAQDYYTKRSYFVKVNVHQVIGDTIEWRYAAEGLWATDDVTAQTAVEAGDGRVVWLIEHGGATQGARQAAFADGLARWSDEQPVDAPALIDLTSVCTWGGTLYAVTTDGAIVASTDGTTWATRADGATLGGAMRFVNLLGVSLKTSVSEDTLRAIVREGDTYKFATTADGATWNIGTTLPAGFPTAGYTRPISVAARPAQGVMTSRLYIVGGRTAAGEMTASTWTCDGRQWAEFQQGQMPPTAGATIVRYTLDTTRPDTFWLLFAGETEDGDGAGELYFSENSGVTWKRLATEYDAYADLAEVRPVAYGTALCDDEYRIYRLGGRDTAGRAVADVATGRLVKLTFARKR